MNSFYIAYCYHKYLAVPIFLTLKFSHPVYVISSSYFGQGHVDLIDNFCYQRQCQFVGSLIILVLVKRLKQRFDPLKNSRMLDNKVVLKVGLYIITDLF